MVVLTSTSSSPAGKLARRIVDSHDIFDNAERLVIIKDNVAVVYKHEFITKKCQKTVHHPDDPNYCHPQREKLIAQRAKLWSKSNDAQSAYYNDRSVRNSKKLDKAQAKLSEFDHEYGNIINARRAWNEVITSEATFETVTCESVVPLNAVFNDDDWKTFEKYSEEIGKSFDYDVNEFKGGCKPQNSVIQLILARDSDKLANFLDNVEKNYHLKWKAFYDLTSSYRMKVLNTTYEGLISLASIEC